LLYTSLTGAMRALEGGAPPSTPWAPHTIPSALREAYPKRARSLAELPPFSRPSVANWVALIEANAGTRRPRPAGPPAIRSLPSSNDMSAGARGAGDEPAAPSGTSVANPIIELPDGTTIEVFPGAPDTKLLELEIVRTGAMTFRTDEGKRAILAA